jgi:hypothetical protein
MFENKGGVSSKQGKALFEARERPSYMKERLF